MTNDDKIELERAARLAQDDIRRLRASNAEMHGKLEIVEMFKALILPRGPVGMAEDPVRLLDRALDKISKSAQAQVTDAMVNRFLSWPIPANLAPPSFSGTSAKPTGINLLDATQARAMLAYVLGQIDSGHGV